MKEFNVTGTCIPSEHYMVDISEKLEKIIQMIEKGKYFTINRARQYGKTTTFAALFRLLKEKYTVIRMSFEGVGEEAFSNDRSFMKYFIYSVSDFLEWTGESDQLILEWKKQEGEEERDSFDYLSKKITRLCKKSTKEVILLIDEVDKSSDNQIFLNFLGMLRNKYLRANEGLDLTFKSVVLAGVYDIKNLKLKLRSEDERKYNSPWNIAADFNVDMSFSPREISTMLLEYEKDHSTGMDVQEMSDELYFYTNGYPVLVSRMCKWVDENGGKEWTKENLRNAERNILKTRNTLFDDLIKNVENNKELRNLIMRILYDGYTQVFNLADPIVELGVMFGIFTEKNHNTEISNVIFETYLYDYVVSVKSREEISALSPDRMTFIQNGKLNMPHILEKFRDLLWSEYRDADEKFLEQNARLLFLCFLKPIINGTGFYYVEPQTRNSTRMDIVVAYGGEEFIIELKIWHGSKYRSNGLKQLESYMESRNAEKGYLVSFSFLKQRKDICGWISEQETAKRIYEVII